MTTHETIDGLRIAFDSRVLKPRPWTAAQSRWGNQLLARLPPGPVLELCAGAGHIGLLTVRGTDRRLVCVEADPVAAAYAVENASSAGLADQVEVREGLMSEVLEADERFPLVVADPPYLRTEEMQRYPEDPALAVDGGEDGLTVVRECLRVIEQHLAPGGTALLQVRDREQAQEVAGLAGRWHLVAVEVQVHAGRGAVVRLERR